MFHTFKNKLFKDKNYSVINDKQHNFFSNTRKFYFWRTSDVKVISPLLFERFQ